MDNMILTGRKTIDELNSDKKLRILATESNLSLGEWFKKGIEKITSRNTNTAIQIQDITDMDIQVKDFFKAVKDMKGFEKDIPFYTHKKIIVPVILGMRKRFSEMNSQILNVATEFDSVVGMISHCDKIMNKILHNEDYRKSVTVFMDKGINEATKKLSEATKKLPSEDITRDTAEIQELIGNYQELRDQEDTISKISRIVNSTKIKKLKKTLTDLNETVEYLVKKLSDGNIHITSELKDKIISDLENTSESVTNIVTIYYMSNQSCDMMRSVIEILLKHKK